MCAAPARTYLAHPLTSAADGHICPTLPHSTTLPKAYMEVLRSFSGPLVFGWDQQVTSGINKDVALPNVVGVTQ